METTLLNLLADFIKITVPSVAIALTVYYLVKKFIERDQELRLLELKMATNKEGRLLKLQAYERLTLFMERISPASVIARVIEPDMISHEMQLAIVRSIRGEFEHNLSQQIYISSNAWNLCVSAKDEIIKAISMIAQQVPPEASAQQLSRIILESIANAGQTLPTQTALEYLKAEAREVI